MAFSPTKSTLFNWPWILPLATVMLLGLLIKITTGAGLCSALGVFSLDSTTKSVLRLAPHRLLAKVYVAISAHYDVHRLEYLRETLEVISHWKTHVDVCIGTNDPVKMMLFLRDPLIRSKFIQEHVKFCTLFDMKFPMMLNWRTRESLADAYNSPTHYSAFGFFEDDLAVTWDALVSWAKDTEILEPANFTRSFVRYEISPETGRTSLLVPNEGPVRSIAFQDDQGYARTFVQLHGISTYSGMFLATRAQLTTFMLSEQWTYERVTHGRWDGGREHASWALQDLNVPDGWVKSGLVPFNNATKAIDTSAWLHHRPNNYLGQGQSLKAINSEIAENVTLSFHSSRKDA